MFRNVLSLLILMSTLVACHTSPGSVSEQLEEAVQAEVETEATPEIKQRGVSYNSTTYLRPKVSINKSRKEIEILGTSSITGRCELDLHEGLIIPYVQPDDSTLYLTINGQMLLFQRIHDQVKGQDTLYGDWKTDIVSADGGRKIITFFIKGKKSINVDLLCNNYFADSEM